MKSMREKNKSTGITEGLAAERLIDEYIHLNNEHSRTLSMFMDIVNQVLRSGKPAPPASLHEMDVLMDQGRQLTKKIEDRAKEYLALVD